MTQKVIRPTKLAHIVIRTAKYKELVDWYGTVLGAWVQHSDPMAAFLTYDDEHHRIAFLNMPHLGEHSRASAGVDHFAFTYASLGDLLTTYERLAEAGIEPVWTINHGATTSFYYRDPDANIVELQIDNFASLEESKQFLSDGRFQINPIGIDFDPREMLARHRAGASDQELTRWPDVVEPRTTPPPAAYLG